MVQVDQSIVMSFGINFGTFDESTDVPPTTEDQTFGESSVHDRNSAAPIIPTAPYSFGVRLEWELGSFSCTPTLPMDADGPDGFGNGWPSPCHGFGFLVPGGTCFRWDDLAVVPGIQNQSAPGSVAPFAYPGYNPFLDSYGNEMLLDGSSGQSVGGQWVYNTYNDTTNTYNANFQNVYAIRSFTGATRVTTYTTIMPPDTYSTASISWGATSGYATQLGVGPIVYPVSGSFLVELIGQSGASLLSYSGSLSGSGGHSGSHTIPPFTATEFFYAKITVSSYSFDVTVCTYAGYANTSVSVSGLDGIVHPYQTNNGAAPYYPALTQSIPSPSSPIQPGDGIVFPAAGMPGMQFDPGPADAFGFPFVLSVGIIVS